MHDEFIFDLSELAILISNTQSTKRRIVVIAMKFYDPIGFVSPVIICFKMLFQELCTCKIGKESSQCSLQEFCNASSEAYAAVVSLKL